MYPNSRSPFLLSLLSSQFPKILLCSAPAGKVTITAEQLAASDVLEITGCSDAEVELLSAATSKVILKDCECWHFASLPFPSPPFHSLPFPLLYSPVPVPARTPMLPSSRPRCPFSPVVSYCGDVDDDGCC